MAFGGIAGGAQASSENGAFLLEKTAGCAIFWLQFSVTVKINKRGA